MSRSSEPTPQHRGSGTPKPGSQGREPRIHYTEAHFSHSSHATLEAKAANASLQRLTGLHNLYASTAFGHAVHSLQSLNKAEREVRVARDRAAAADLAVQNVSEDADLFALEQKRSEAVFQRWATEMSSFC